MVDYLTSAYLRSEPSVLGISTISCGNACEFAGRLLLIIGLASIVTWLTEVLGTIVRRGIATIEVIVTVVTTEV
jgi:hypothetical protein